MRQYRQVVFVFYDKRNIDDISCVDYAWIYHNKDKQEPHYHFYAKFNSPKSHKTLLNFCKKQKDKYGQNIFFEPLKSDQLITYFLHQKQPDKYQYKVTDIHSSLSELKIDKEIIKKDKSTTLAEVAIDLLDRGYPIPIIIRQNPKLLYSISALVKYKELLSTIDFIPQKKETASQITADLIFEAKKEENYSLQKK